MNAALLCDTLSCQGPAVVKNLCVKLKLVAKLFEGTMRIRTLGRQK